MSTRQEPVRALTDVEHWDRTWSNRDVPRPMDPRTPGLNGTVARALHAYFAEMVGRAGMRPGDSILEAGCGGSVVLPYFAREFGLYADGVDNSPEGCALSEAIGRDSGAGGRIACADVFDPPPDMAGRYQMVYSLGLAEHFTPTRRILEALRAYLAPGGWMVTLVPNMRGLTGWMQRLADRDVYAMHVPLTPDTLREAHVASGLEVVDSRYLMAANFSVVNFSAPTSRVPANLGLRVASGSSKAVWLAERCGLPIRANSFTSPYVAVAARLP